MKKIITLFTFTILLTQCKKAETEVISETEGISKKMKDYLYYEGNPEMTKINNIMYAYLSGMQQVFTEKPVLLKMLFDKIKLPYRNAVFLKRFITGSAQCKTSFNSAINTLFPEKNNSTDHAVAMAYEMIYDSLGYEPTVTLYNAERALLNGEYYLALLVEPDEVADTTMEYIPAYHYRKDNTFKLELIEANDVYYGNIPVFIFQFDLDKNYPVPGTGTQNHQYLAPLPNASDPETFNPQDPVRVFVNAFPYITAPGPYKAPKPTAPVPGIIQNESANLYAHHEKKGNASEYAMTSRVSYTGGSSVWNTNELIANVSKETVDCGCYVSISQSFDTNTITGQYFSFLTFEKDWFASSKTLAIPGFSPFYYQATAASDTYVYAAGVNVNVDFPGTPPVLKEYNNGPGVNRFRRH